MLLSNGENAFTLEITIVYSLCPALNYWRVGYLVEKAENAKYNLDFKRPEYLPMEKPVPAVQLFTVRFII